MAEPSPILRVTVGSPVYTADDQALGKVKEVRGPAFKVQTGLFQRDYWLRADSVRQAVPDQTVVLVADKAHIDDYKIEEPRSGV